MDPLLMEWYHPSQECRDIHLSRMVLLRKWGLLSLDIVDHILGSKATALRPLHKLLLLQLRDSIQTPSPARFR